MIKSIDPTPAEIRERAAIVRSTWTLQTERKRLGLLERFEWSRPVMHLEIPDDLPVDWWDE